jgi:hypothetical protein
LPASESVTPAPLGQLPVPCLVFFNYCAQIFSKYTDGTFELEPRISTPARRMKLEMSRKCCDSPALGRIGSEGRPRQREIALLEIHLIWRLREKTAHVFSVPVDRHSS